MEVRIVPLTLQVLAAEEFSGADAARVLDVAPPVAWPPQFNDAGTRAHFRNLIIEHPGEEHWLGAYVVADLDGVPTLVGSAGFKGPPHGGTVEIGYAVADPYQRRGIGTATVRALLTMAFSDAHVAAVRAETLPTLTASRGLLTATGFVEIGRRHDRDDGEIIVYSIQRDAVPDENSPAQSTS